MVKDINSGGDSTLNRWWSWAAMFFSRPTTGLLVPSSGAPTAQKTAPFCSRHPLGRHRLDFSDRQSDVRTSQRDRIPRQQRNFRLCLPIRRHFERHVPRKHGIWLSQMPCLKWAPKSLSKAMPLEKGANLYVTDGTLAGTSALAEVDPGASDGLTNTMFYHFSGKRDFCWDGGRGRR